MSKVSKVTIITVVAIAIIAFVLSYENIRALAIDVGLTPFQAALFPIVIDAAMLVFAMSMMDRAVQDREGGRAWGLSILVGLYAALSIAFNVWHSNLTVVGVTIAITIPATLFFTFETAMGQVKRHVQEHGSSLTKQLDKAAGVNRKLERRVKQLESKLEKSDKEVERLRMELAQAATKKRKARGKRNNNETREKVIKLVKENPGETYTWIGKQLGISRQAVGQHVKAANGQLTGG